MTLNKISTVVFRFVVSAKVALLQVAAGAAALMAIKAEGLLMALLTVVAGIVCQGAVVAYKVGTMVGSDPFGLVAVATFSQLHAGEISVGCLLVSKAQLVQEGYSHDENRTENK